MMGTTPSTRCCLKLRSPARIEGRNYAMLGSHSHPRCAQSHPLKTHSYCLDRGLETSSMLEFGDLAKSQMSFGETHQTPTYCG